MSVIEKKMQTAIEAAIPNSHAEVQGRGKHFSIRVVSPAFAEKSMLNSHRMVHSAIKSFMTGAEAPVHAIDELVTLSQ